MKQECDKLIESQKSVESTLMSHRFWLGEEIYNRSKEFHNSFPKFCQEFKEGNFEKCLDTEKKMKAKLMNVDEVLKLLLKQTCD